ncbi:MAG: carbohydrate kinase [Desulfovibrio sp.]|nr:carbohydrate kinase [Desulfovibrio sp.]
MNNGDIVVGLGEALWDILPDGKKLGGAPANFAYHCARCGLDSWAVSAIGDDKLGEEIAEQLSEKQVNYIMEVVPYPTGTVQVELSPAGVPTYEIKSGVAWDNLPFTPRIEELAKKTRAVSFGSLAQRSVVTRNSIDAFLDAMPQDNDRFIVFDVNLRQNFYTPECLESSMERCNILKINDEELIAVSRMFGYPGIDLKDKCWLLLGRHNLKVLVLTCGVNGSYVFTPGHVSFLPTPNVEVADTIGAGDSFSAVFVSSLLKGCSVKQAHHNAVYYSAFVCTQHGAMPEYPESLKEQVSVLP